MRVVRTTRGRRKLFHIHTAFGDTETQAEIPPNRSKHLELRFISTKNAPKCQIKLTFSSQEPNGTTNVVISPIQIYRSNQYDREGKEIRVPMLCVEAPRVNVMVVHLSRMQKELSFTKSFLLRRGVSIRLVLICWEKYANKLMTE